MEMQFIFYHKQAKMQLIITESFFIPSLLWVLLPDAHESGQSASGLFQNPRIRTVKSTVNQKRIPLLSLI